MATQAKHSPLPWAQRTHPNLENPDIYDTGGKMIARVEGLSDGIDNKGRLLETYANAAYIVQACNAFPALVEALCEVSKYWSICKIKAPAGLESQIGAALLKAGEL
jgi:hypothetical protein